jgi:glyoxylase I family protein
VQSHEPDGHLYWAMLRLGDATLMLNAQYEDEDRPAQEPPSLPGHHDVTLYFDCPDVDAAHKHLEAKDVKSSGPKVTYYKMKQLTVTDPDGYQLCFQQPV